MLDTLVKTTLFLAAPALIDHMVRGATGAPLHLSLGGWLSHPGEAPKLILAFGILAALTFSGAAYGIAKDLYQSLISRRKTAFFLGYNNHQEHYLIHEDGHAHPVDIRYPGPGECRLDRLYRPATLMYNPLSRMHWPLKETRSAKLMFFVAAGALLFALVTLGYAHVLYLDIYMHKLLAGASPGALGPQDLVPYFMKALVSHLPADPLPFAVLSALLLGAFILPSQPHEKNIGASGEYPLPEPIKPGAILTATLSDTVSTSVVLNEKPGNLHASSNQKTYHYAIFELAGLYPHTVWAASRLGSDSPADKNDGVYTSVRDEFEKRTVYEDATPLAEHLSKLTASRPPMQVRVTTNLTLDWTAEPSLNRKFAPGRDPA